MKDEGRHIIYTIGHSTHSIDDFIAMLKSFGVTMLADIRNFPGSKRYPHFNKEALEISLQQQNIGYIHLKELGGRRKPVVGSVNTAWRSEAFRGYADYMETDAFKTAMLGLQNFAIEQPTAYMCAEAVWWRCHRALVSDWLKIRGWKVMHIMTTLKTDEHPYTPAAKIIDEQLSYSEARLF